MRRTITAAGAIAGTIVLAAAGAALLVPGLANAADPTASPSAASSAPATANGCGAGDHGGTTEAVSDTSVVAKVIGITEAQLNTELSNGQTIAHVAAAHNVDVQKVIDALVADKKTELAAAVQAGTLTQAQADAQAANATQFVTDQVNGTGFGPGGRGHGGDHDADGAPTASPSTSSNG